MVLTVKVAEMTDVLNPTYQDAEAAHVKAASALRIHSVAIQDGTHSVLRPA